MGRAVLYISSELLVDLFKAGPPRSYAIRSGGLPEDTRLVEVAHARYMGEPLTIALLLESETWPEVEDGQLPPELSPVVASVVPIVIPYEPGK